MSKVINLIPGIPGGIEVKDENGNIIEKYENFNDAPESLKQEVFGVVKSLETEEKEAN